jgi:hypothetical protein
MRILAVGAALAALLPLGLVAESAIRSGPSSAALRQLIAHADLHYAAPPERSEDGIPLGNGRMGSLIWTTPTEVRLQINRVDVQPISGSTTSFFERNSDYMGGCGFVDFDLGAAGEDVFTSDGCPQHLSVYDGLATLTAHGVKVRGVALPGVDVMAFAIDDHRANPQPLSVNLRMLRYASQYFGGQLETMAAQHVVTVRTREHTAASQLIIRGDRIVLAQEFREGTHVAKSAVAIAISGRAARPRFTNETTVTLASPSADGAKPALILVASAATLDPDEDVVAVALGNLDQAAFLRGTGVSPVGVAQAGDNHGQDARATFAALAAQTADWWHAFWARGALDLHSADGVADYVAENYHYYLYLMAATSRGKFPPKFNGMIWNTAGDLRTWGAQHWFANLSCYYEALFATNRLELLDPMFDMYSGMAAAAATAARQQWGSEGLFIPETVWYDGLAALPDDIAPELRDLFLMRKPWADRSPRFNEFAATGHPHSSRWNFWGGGRWVNGRWVPVDRGFGPFGPVTHNFATTAKVAYLFWRRYEYSLDAGWLRTRAYPMLKGAAEFYHHFPNLRRDAAGVVHIEHTNSNESVLDTRDSDEDLAAMRGVFAAAIRAAEILDVDQPLRAQWRDLLDHLAPLPTTADPDALKPADYSGPRVFARGRTPAVSVRGYSLDGNSLPQWFFDLCNRDSTNADGLVVANATFDRMIRGGAIGANTGVGVLSKVAIAGATLGRVDAARFLVPNQIHVLTLERGTAYRGGGVLANRLTLREGPQAFDAQRLGRAAEALQIALLNSTPPAPAAEPTIRVFSAWPAEWDATFTLRARGAFVVSAAQKNGRVEFVEVVSEAGALLQLYNPWGDAEVTLVRDGAAPERIRGSVFSVATRAGERLRFEP